MDETPEHEVTVKKFRAELLDQPVNERMVRIEPVFMDDKVLDHEGKQIPRLKGLGFHMHAKSIIVDENGVSEQWSCDYVALDTQQIYMLKNALDTLLYIQEED